MKPAARRSAAQHPALSVHDLVEIDRLGAPTLSPDGTEVVCSVTRGSMEHNRSTTHLWRWSTGARPSPRQLTACGDKDGQPQWSPRGDRIAFLARREQQGQRDRTSQLYLIAVDGGEAERAATFAPGIESFKWMPDGRRIVFAAWVWPDAKGAAAQARRHKDFSERKESAYATSEAYYRHWDHNLPMGRVLHLLLLDLVSGRITDLFEGLDVELPRDAAGQHVYDPHPDGRRVAFAHEPERPTMPGQRGALAEVTIRGRRISTLADDPDWDFGAPRWQPGGGALAFTAAHIAQRHTAFDRPALLRPGAPWRLLDEADRDIDAPLRWSADGSALLFTAQQRGRCHLWRLDLETGGGSIAVEGGWVQGFDTAADLLVTCSDAARHPARLFVSRTGQPPRRLDRFNDALLARRTLGATQELTLTGALGDAVQMWLTFPPGFDARRRHPLLQVIHGGPFSASGDSFSQRWNAHVLASRGHVVAQVNYHGSSGFGVDFRDSIMGRQGALELQDIEAGSDWLLAQPWADQQRLSAAGGSYGGFLVAWMNGHVAPGRYRSFVCHAGVFDRVATFAADSYVDRPRDLGARYWDDMGKVLAQSPHSAAAKMHTPTLVIHGALDHRVPDCNALAYYNTLKARGVDARLLWFPDENHWVLKPANSKLWHAEFLDWVQSHESAARRSRA